MSTSPSTNASVDVVAEDDSQYELIDSLASPAKKNSKREMGLVDAVRKLEKELEVVKEKVEFAEKKEIVNEDVSGKFTVNFTEISKLSDKKKVFSPEFEVAGMKWKLCFFVVRGYFGAYPVLAAPERAKCTASYKITVFNNAGTAKVIDSDNMCFIAGEDKFSFDTCESFTFEIECALRYVENLLWPAEYYNAEDDSISMQVDLTVHASFGGATVVSVGPKDEKEKAKEKKKEHSSLPKKPSRECECSIL